MRAAFKIRALLNAGSVQKVEKISGKNTEAISCGRTQDAVKINDPNSILESLNRRCWVLAIAVDPPIRLGETKCTNSRTAERPIIENGI